MVAQTFLSVSYRREVPLVRDEREDAIKGAPSAKYTDKNVCATLCEKFLNRVFGGRN